jgi:hypothetical protein
MLCLARAVVPIVHRLLFISLVGAVLMAAVTAKVIVPVTPSSAVHAGRRSLGSNLAGTLLLEIATAVEAFDTIRYATRFGRMTMLGTPLAEGRVARTFVTLEQPGVVMPTLASLVVALPGALAFPLVSYVRTSATGRGIPLLSAVGPVPSAVVDDFAMVATTTTSFVPAITRSATAATRDVSATTRSSTLTRRSVVGLLERVICVITVNRRLGSEHAL